MNKPRNWFTLEFLVVVSLAAFLSSPIPIAVAQNKGLGDDRERGKSMLKKIKDDLKRDYYDPKFRGMNVDARFKDAAAKIDEAHSVGQIMGIIATVLGELDDSHTFFVPPARTLQTDYGWTMMTIGERCFVSSVTKGSDAEAKGVKPGDEVLEADGYTLGRPNLWRRNHGSLSHAAARRYSTASWSFSLTADQHPRLKSLHEPFNSKREGQLSGIKLPEG